MGNFPQKVPKCSYCTCSLAQIRRSISAKFEKSDLEPFRGTSFPNRSYLAAFGPFWSPPLPGNEFGQKPRLFLTNSFPGAVEVPKTHKCGEIKNLKMQQSSTHLRKPPKPAPGNEFLINLQPKVSRRIWPKCPLGPPGNEFPKPHFP